MVKNIVLIIKSIEKISGKSIFCSGPKNTIDEMAFIKIILVYSAIKNRANGPAAYSTLKPETSSDSPSVKSNGLRLVSARVEIYHIIASGQAGKINQIASCVVLKVWREREPLIKKVDKRMIAIVTSYEIVWATARKAPNKEYFELEAHPDHRIE